MRSIIFGAALVAACIAVDLPTVYEKDFIEGWFDNKIDHFNY
jgi:hypothetical protein